MQAISSNLEADIVCDVLIIGAGPVGLVTANLLGLQGVRTIVLERNAALYDTPRAILIDDESFRTLQAAGLDHEFAPFVRRGQGARYYDEDGNPFVSVGPGPQDLGFPKRQHFLQPELERVLLNGTNRFTGAGAVTDTTTDADARVRGASEKNGDCAIVRVLFGHELVDFAQDDAMVTARVRRVSAEEQRPAAGSSDGSSGSVSHELIIRARYLLGADGARSRVRRQLGINMLGESYPEDWVIFDMANDRDQEPVSKFYCSKEKPYVSVVAPHGMRRFEFRAHASDTSTGPSTAKERTGAGVRANLTVVQARRYLAGIRDDIAEQNIVRAAMYRFEARVAERWRDGRVFLLGDAAHLTPPFAGQGMNAGFRDAHNIAWKLGVVLALRTHPAHASASAMTSDILLDSYEIERRPAAEAMIQLAVAMGDIIMPQDDADVAFRRQAMEWLARFDGAKEWVAGMKFKPKPSYSAGAFVDVAQQPFTGSIVGQMLPQPPLVGARLDDVIGHGFAIVVQQPAVARFAAAQRALLWPELTPTLVAIYTAPHEELGAGETQADDAPRKLQPDRSNPHCVAPLAALMVHRDQLLLIRPDRYVAAAFWPSLRSASDAVAAFRVQLGQAGAAASGGSSRL